MALAGVAGLGALARRGTKKKNIAAAQLRRLRPAGRPQTINWTMNYGRGAAKVVPTLWHQAGWVVFDLLILPDQPKAQAFYHQVRGSGRGCPACPGSWLPPASPPASGQREHSALTVDGRRACLSSDGWNFCGCPDEPDAAAWRAVSRQLLLARRLA